MMRFQYFNIHWLLSISLICTSFISMHISADVYTAIVELEGLVKTEEALIGAMKTHISEREQKLDFLKRRIAHYEKENEKAEKEAVEYLANPINIYLLIKRLTMDWKFNKTYISDAEYEGIKSKVVELNLDFPTEEDLNGAALSLTRLQETYSLSTESIAKGELNGIVYSSELSSDDCFEIGRQSYINGDFGHTVSWMNEALRRREQSADTDMVTPLWQILEYLATSAYVEGNLELAYNTTQSLLTVMPSNHHVQINLQKLKEQMKTEGKQRDLTMKRSDYYTRYELLCREAVQLPINITSKLKCRYVHKNNPYLLIAPFKEEEAYLKPKIYLYHDVLSSNEIEILKNLSRPQLIRSKVATGKVEGGEVENIRTSKIAWLEEQVDPTVANILRRIADMTSLTMEAAEMLQVCNYGLGGHYVPHTDYFEDGNASPLLATMGNRIATVLFYMSEVAQGGATVFPYLDVALWPKQGTAAFWYNLHSSGVPDSLTMHGACPVLQGSKWASNLWIREVGQEFYRPCDQADAPVNKTQSSTAPQNPQDPEHSDAYRRRIFWESLSRRIAFATAQIKRKKSI